MNKSEDIRDKSNSLFCSSQLLSNENMKIINKIIDLFLYQ